MTATAAAVSEKAPKVTGPEHLCACMNVSVAEFEGFVWANPEMAFDTCLARTGVGSKCTACLLNAEHHFVEAAGSRDVGAAGSVKTVRAKRSLNIRDLRSAVWRLVDWIAPAAVIPLRSLMPVLHGPDLQQYLIISNQPLLYKNRSQLSDFDISWTIRDHEGVERARENRTVRVGDNLRINLSDYLSKHDGRTIESDGLPGIGSIELMRRALRPGVRGTTRPQIELVSKAGSCAVHGQDAGLNRGNLVHCHHRPDEERQLLSVVSFDDKPLDIEISTKDLEGAPAPGLGTKPAVVTVPPNGARLIDVTALEADMLKDELGGMPFEPARVRQVAWRCIGRYRVHFLISSPNFDRFSIDHV